jgi:hypothetical protein
MAITEAGSFWAADMLWRLDMMSMRDHGARKMADTHGIMKMLPSEYFDRNCGIGSSNTRRRELARRYEIGVGNIMWGNDFPHPEGTWPYTREFLKDRFWDIPIDETEQILGLNQAEFYGFDLEKLASRTGSAPRRRSLGRPMPRSSEVDDLRGRPPPAHRQGKPPAPACTDPSTCWRTSREGANVTTPDQPRRIANWPLLKVVYRTDPDKIVISCHPASNRAPTERVREHLQRAGEGEPEYGVSTKVAPTTGPPATGSGSASTRNRRSSSARVERSAQVPVLHRLLPSRRDVEKRCTHQGYIPRVPRQVTAVADDDLPTTRARLWIKSSSAAGGVEKSYDFPPHVVDVASVQQTVRREIVDGTLVLRDSPWDPYTTLLPMREQVSANLVWSASKSRGITLAGPLDPIAFWPYADTIGGSRWPGLMGGPRFEH